MTRRLAISELLFVLIGTPALLAQSTKDMDWSSLGLAVYATNAQVAQGLICLRPDNMLHRVSLPRGAGNYPLSANPLAGRSTLTVRMYTS